MTQFKRIMRMEGNVIDAFGYWIFGKKLLPVLQLLLVWHIAEIIIRRLM